MIKFECDTCKIETDNYMKSKNNGETIPKHWITLSNVTIHNERSTAALIYAGNITMHFCSEKCFKDKFFKTDEQLTATMNNLQ